MSSTARIFSPVGSYTGDNPGTVPALTAGTISNVSPAIGAVLTVTSSNAPAGVSTFNWEYRVTPGSGLWGNAGGTRNGATYDTAGQSPGEYRRGVSTPNQTTMVYTPGVTVSGANPWVLNEDFAGLGNGILQTTGGGWTRIINNGDGAIAGTGTGTIRSPRQSGGSSFPGATNRFDTNIATNQEVEVDIVAHTGVANTELGVAVRANGTDGLCYQVRHNIGAGAIEVRKGNNWAAALLGSAFTYSTTVPWTMRVVARTVGATCVIEVYNGTTLINSWTDSSSPYTGQRVGISALTGGADGTTGARTITAIRGRQFI